MKRLFTHRVVCGLMLALFLLPALPSSAYAQSDQEALISFLRESLPQVDGTVVSKDGGTIHVELERGRGGVVPVEIFRRGVDVGSDGEQQLKERQIGEGNLAETGRDLARLQVEDSLYSRIRPGDRVRNKPFRLLVDDRTGIWTPRLTQAVEDLSQVQSVHVQRPETEDRSVQLRLILTEKQFQLKRAGEWGTLATRDRLSRQGSQPTGREQPESDEPRLERFTTVDRVLQDAAFIQLPNYPRIQLVQFATRTQIGFARIREEGLRSLRWHDVPGEILDITPLHRRMDGLSSLPFLVVMRQGGSISTRMYSYDLNQRQMVRRWSSRHVWINQVNGRLYGWRIGLNEPFKKAAFPVRVDENGWDWREKESPRIPAVTVPTSGQWVAENFLRLNKDGNVEVFRDGQRSYASSQVYGGHPVSIQARRAQTEMDRHPAFVAWPVSREVRMVVPNNQPEGIPYFKGLQSYSASRLYLLSAQSRFIDTLWESERLSGYVAGIFPSGDQLWVITVNPSDEFSVLQRLVNVGFTGEDQ